MLNTSLLFIAIMNTVVLGSSFLPSLDGEAVSTLGGVLCSRFFSAEVLKRFVAAWGRCFRLAMKNRYTKFVQYLR